MIVHQIFALIFDGEIKDRCVCNDYELANYLARAVYGKTAFAVDCLQYPCDIGDKYHNNAFYRVDPETQEETLIKYVPTQEQQVQELKAENEALMVVVSDLIGGAYNA